MPLGFEAEADRLGGSEGTDVSFDWDMSRCRQGESRSCTNWKKLEQKSADVWTREWKMWGDYRTEPDS